MRCSLNIVNVTMRFFLEIVTVTMSYFLNVVTVTIRYSLNIVTVTMCNLFLKINLRMAQHDCMVIQNNIQGGRM